MPKTKKDLLCAIAQKIGGEHGMHLCELLRAGALFDDLLDCPIPEDHFLMELRRTPADLPAVFARMEFLAHAKPTEFSRRTA